MGEPKDKILLCRQCGKDFTFTISEQEYHKERGWSEPRRCPQCRSARRKIDVRVCSGCAAELAKEDPVYCSVCLENIKRDVEGKLHGQQKMIEKLESRLKTVNDMDKRLALVTAELNESQQANEELRDKVKALDFENLKLTRENAPWQSIGASVQQLGERFEALRLSYAYDVDKLTGLLLEVQNQLTQRQNVSLLRRIKLMLSRSGKPNEFQVPEGEKGTDKSSKPQ